MRQKLTLCVSGLMLLLVLTGCSLGFLVGDSDSSAVFGGVGTFLDDNGFLFDYNNRDARLFAVTSPRYIGTESSVIHNSSTSASTGLQSIKAASDQQSINPLQTRIPTLESLANQNRLGFAGHVAQQGKDTFIETKPYKQGYGCDMKKVEAYLKRSGYKVKMVKIK